MYQVYLSKKGTRMTTAAAVKPLLSKADTKRGEEIFHGRGTCFACHQVKGKGIVVGPELVGINSVNPGQAGERSGASTEEKQSLWLANRAEQLGATVTVDDLALGNRTVVVPFDLDAISGMTVGSGKSDKAFSPSTYLAYFLLSWLGADVVSGIDDVPGVGQVTVAAHPNPFNPSTTIAFELPRAAEVSLDIYDLQGRLVRRLLDESPYVSGAHKQVWDGRDGDGRVTSSGVYFYRFATGDQKRVGKLTLLK